MAQMSYLCECGKQHAGPVFYKEKIAGCDAPDPLPAEAIILIVRPTPKGMFRIIARAACGKEMEI